MEKEIIEIDDIKKVVELLVEYRPIVKYYTQYEYHGYSQTNETSLNLRKVGWEFEDNEIEDFDYHNGFGEYDENKPSYHDDVYECDINTLKLDSFIEMINNYIHLRGEDYDDWSCDTFFEWFQEIDKKQIIDEDKWSSTCGYSELENHDISWCVGTDNYNYHGIKIETIETDKKIYSFSGFWGDYDGE